MTNASCQSGILITDSLPRAKAPAVHTMMAHLIGVQLASDLYEIKAKGNRNE